MKMKYHIGFYLFLVMIWAPTVHAKLQVVASTPDLGALAREIGKDKVEVTNLAKPTEDPHFVDAKPSFIVKLNKADILVEGGLHLEIGWLPNLVMSARNKKILAGTPGYFIAATNIQVLEIPDVTPDRAREMGDVHPLGNPHFLLDPFNGKVVATNICDRLCKIDMENSVYYKSNLNNFIQRLDQKLSEWQKQLEPFKGAKIITYHKTFSYLAHRFDLQVIGALEPKPGIPPSPTHINNLIPLMKYEGVKIILAESFRERKTPEFVAAQTGAKVVIVPIMPGGVKGVEDFIALFDYNIHQIVSALRG